MIDIKIIKLIFALIISSIILFSCGYFREQRLSEKDIKDKLMKNHPIESGWKELELENEFPKEVDLAGKHYFYQPVDLALCGGSLFVADSYLHKIIKFNLNGVYEGEIGEKGEGPGQFIFPNKIVSSNKNQLFILEGGKPRMQIIDTSGNYLGEFKIYEFINNYIVINEYIYANCFYHDESENWPLIVKYDLLGKKLSQFGKRIGQKGHRTYDSSVFLSYDEGELYCLFQHYPIVRSYNLEGELNREITINIKIFNELKKYNYKRWYTNPAENVVRLPRLFAGIRAIDKKIFILANLPRLEIIELDYYGGIKNYYYSKKLKDVINLSGFDVVIDRENKKVLFYILQSYENQKLYIFSSEYMN